MTTTTTVTASETQQGVDGGGRILGKKAAGWNGWLGAGTDHRIVHSHGYLHRQKRQRRELL
jgi:hypothetical protein